RVEPKVPASEPGATNRKENVVAHDDLNADNRDRLGTPEADAPVAEAIEQPNAEAPVAAAAIATLSDSVVTVDKAAFEELQANAKAGAEARAELDKQRRDRIVAAALETGRIAPDSSETWRAQLDKDEDGTAKLLASLPANTIPVVETGHTVETTADDAAYNRVYGSNEKEA
ncbi:MAG: phage protease, partial [Leucobacter sp.]